MAFDSVPWLVGGGAEHSPEVGRLLAHAATSGSSGIVDVTDLRVQAQPTPGNSVRIAPGSAIIPNSWSTQQSYLARNATETSLTIPSTDSTSGRSDLIVVRIDDPQYAGQPPADPKVGPYVRADVISGVSPTAIRANVAFPHIVLARIDIPVSTATITESMITDLRNMALPRKERTLRTVAVSYSDLDQLSYGAEGGEIWPKKGTWQVEVPEWATRVNVLGVWSQIYFRTGTTRANLWVALGHDRSDGIRTQHSGLDGPNATDNPMRGTQSVADFLAVPKSMRGDVVEVTMRGQRTAASSAEAYARSDGYTAAYVDLEFLQAPDHG